VADPHHCTLVTGPASSGKSRWAEVLAARSGLAVHYLATGPLLPHDAAWQERLRRHRERRPAHWQLHEVGADLAAALLLLEPDSLALVDSLGTWVAACLERDAAAWQQCCAALSSALERTPARVVLVAEETTWGVVPSTAAGGLFRDRLGTLQQQLIGLCGSAWLVVHGRALDLLALSQPVP
jgi:adenosylcobinamide kinase / adenosylcobinamide-phosphate guanylyltransferase